jgi:hypothetical protein
MPGADWLFDYVSDALDILPQEDRDLVAEFWQGLIQIVASVQQRALETDINRYVDYVQPYRTERWESYTLNLSTATISEQSEEVIFSSSGASVSLSHAALMYWGLLLTRTSTGTVYRLGVDFSLDFVTGTITHIAGGNIQVGSPLKIRYYYMADVGPFAGYPYALGIDEKTVSIPKLQTEITPTESTRFLYENVDYVVGSGFIAFAAPPPTTTWAEISLLNDQTPWRNFGAMIDFYLESSPQYVAALQGLYYAYFTGSQVGTIENAVALLLGLPVALDAGEVTGIIDTAVEVPIVSTTKPYTITTDGSIDLTTILEPGGLVRVIGVGSYTYALPIASVTPTTVELKQDAFATSTPAAATLKIPRQVRYKGSGRPRVAEVYDGLTLKYTVGDTVKKWAALTNGATVIDKVVDPDFVVSEVGRAGIARFLTDLATVGPAASTDESKALEMLASHLWVMQINGAVFNYLVTYGDIRTFLDRVKPAYTEYILSVLESFSDPVVIDETLHPVDVVIDLTYTVGSNFPNQMTWGTGIAVVSWDQATRTVTVTGHDLNELGNVGELVEMRGFGADDGEYLIQSIPTPTTIVMLQAPSSNYGAGVGEIILSSTSEEYIAAGGYPNLNVGAGHVAIDSTLIFDLQAGLYEIKESLGDYFLHAPPGEARFTVFAEVGDVVVVSGSTQDGSYTVAEVVDDDTLRVDEAVVTESGPIGGTMTITKAR